MSDWRAREGLGPEASSPLNLGPSPPGFTVSAAGSGSVSPGLHLERVHGGCDFWPCFQDRPGQPGEGGRVLPRADLSCPPAHGGPRTRRRAEQPCLFGMLPREVALASTAMLWGEGREPGSPAEESLSSPGRQARRGPAPLGGFEGPLGHRAWHPRHLLARSVSPSSRRPRAGTLGAELRARGRRGRCR